MAYKRKRRSTWSRRYRRRTSRYPTRRIGRRRRYVRRSSSKKLNPRRFRARSTGAALAPKIHIVSTIKTPPLYKQLMKISGRTMWVRHHFSGNTSVTTGNNPLVYRIHPSLDKSSCAVAGWTSAVNWGDHYDQTMVMKRQYLLRLSRFHISVNQGLENASVRLCWAKRKNRKWATSNNIMEGWTADVHRPQNFEEWKVLWERRFVFDQPRLTDTNGELALDNNARKKVYLTIPFNRVIKWPDPHTNPSDSGSSTQGWEGAGANWNDHAFFRIDSDDATSIDSEYVTVEMFVEHLIVLPQ